MSTYKTRIAPKFLRKIRRYTETMPQKPRKCLILGAIAWTGGIVYSRFVPRHEQIPRLLITILDGLGRLEMSSDRSR